MARALRRAAVLVVLRCAAALQPLQGAALAIPGLDRGGRIRTIADVEFRSLFREFKVGDCVPANAAVDGWTVVLYPKGRSNAAGERGRVCVAVRRPNEDQGGQEGDRGVACVDASVTVRLCGAQAEGRRFDVESQGGARFVPRGARADRGSGRVEECGLSLLQADLCKGFVDEAGVMRAKITIETFDAVSIDALGYDALGSDAGLALSPPRRALSRLDARRTRDGVHLGTHVVPLWANLEERAKLGETGCYGGVDFVVERIVDASGCDVFSVVPGGGDVLYMRPVYPLVARLEREWPVSVPEKDLGLLLRPAAYAAVQLGTTLSAALATLATAVLVSTFLVSVSVVPSRSMEPYILPGDVLLVEKASSAVLRREPLRGEVVLFAPPIALRRIVQETSPNALSGDTLFVKRVAAVAGDRVEILDGFSVRVNGAVVGAACRDCEPLARTLDRAKALGVSPRANFVVPPGSIFVLGDYGEVSIDSRFWGPLETSLVKARPVTTLHRR